MQGDACVGLIDKRQAVVKRQDDRKLNNTEFHDRPPYLQSNALREWRNPPRANNRRERRSAFNRPRHSRITFKEGLEERIEPDALV
jgi:hypothetical protein